MGQLDCPPPQQWSKAGCRAAKLQIKDVHLIDVLFTLCKNVFFIFLLGFTPCKAEQPLRGMELQEKNHKKDYRIQKIYLERTYS